MSDDITVDPTAVDPEPEALVHDTKQVEEPRVIFVPKQDFTARVNQDDFNFRKDVPTKVDRSVANMLLEDPDRGYIRD